MTDHHPVRSMEGSVRVVGENENIELAQTKVMTVNCREVPNSPIRLSSSARRRSKSSVEAAANCKTS